MASSAGSTPSRSRWLTETGVSPAATSTIVGRSRETASSMSTSSSTLPESNSCTVAIAATRRTASTSADRASSLDVRRACRRNSADTDCRLFLTR
ncbi:Uncharacterised protein [Mycobacteroides abscessus subsp. abscessus]|nr:Uncharacterised protein [Mycobacteroides abscessus subsp. abscessus]